MNENEEPPVTEAELARVAELDAPATQGPWRPLAWDDCQAAMMSDDQNNPLVCTVSTGRGREHGVSNTNLIAEYRTLTPRLARELAAARAAIKAFLEKAQVYGRCGETNHPAVKCDVQGLTLGDFYALSAALNTPHP